MNIFQRLYLKYKVWRIKPPKINNLNIKVYQSVAPDGCISFTTKRSDSRGSGNSSNIPSICSQVLFEAQEHHKKYFGQVTIDFTPYHQIEWPDTLAPQRCIPLSEINQEEFWKELLKQRK